MKELLELKYDWLHSQIILNSPAKLYQLAIIKIAVSLWYEEVEWLVEDIYKVNINLQEKISLMILPERFRNNIAQMAELIRNQLRELLEFLPEKFFKHNWWNVLKTNIYWSLQGTIDKKRTTEALTGSIELDVETRFQTAVVFCLEDRIDALSIQMPIDYLKSNADWYDKISAMATLSVSREHFGITEVFSDYKLSFDRMVTIRNELGYHYFWHHLTEQEKLHILESEFVHHCYADHNNNYILFLFTQLDENKKLQLLQKDPECLYIMEQLLSLQLLPLFHICANDVLKFLTLESLTYFSFACSELLDVSVAYRKNYIEICAMLPQFFSSKSSSHTNCLIEPVIDSLVNFMREGETNLAKDLLQSISSEWIKRWFTVDSSYLSWFVIKLLKCGLLEFVFNLVFSSMEERGKFVSEGHFDDVVCKLIVDGEPLEYVDRIFDLLLPCCEDVKSYKLKFAEDNGSSVCADCLESGQWKIANEFLQWSFVSREKIICFFNGFFRTGYFGLLFKADKLKKSIYSLLSLVKANNSFIDRDVIPNACLAVIFFGYSSHCDKEAIQDFFEAIDLFFLAFFNDDNEKLVTMKKELFTDTEKKLYIALPMAYLQMLKNNSESETNWKQNDELWRRMIDDFFTWISSSDANLKEELEKGFWHHFYTETCANV